VEIVPSVEAVAVDAEVIEDVETVVVVDEDVEAVVDEAVDNADPTSPTRSCSPNLVKLSRLAPPEQLEQTLCSGLNN
jgi:hypothetical protein